MVPTGAELDWRVVLEHLHDARGVRRLMVEGGGRVHTQLMTQGLANELRARRRAALRGGAGRATAVRTRGISAGPDAAGGDTTGRGRRSSSATSPPHPGEGALASAADRHWLGVACELAALCPPSETAFSVGAVVVAADDELARGHSREGDDPVVHAEEAALAKIDPTDPRLRSATVYSSLEPCARRASRPAPCARLILDAGVRRVVTAWREPDTFVTEADGNGLLVAGWGRGVDHTAGVRGAGRGAQ